jgi:hypothetical protein
MQQSSEQNQIDQIVSRLAASYPTVPQTRIADVVRTAHEGFDGRPLREFVPLFVERRAKRTLAAFA